MKRVVFLVSQSLRPPLGSLIDRLALRCKLPFSKSIPTTTR